ncbi:uncharacterized protein LOC135844958 isoform X6 [Planococcus citri]|uniref:uncharacterized protein LOC135844958 isoform X6 n=1 Tax=Planococcus citri TaxID=170843 RepID=UPI0031F9B596
MDSNADNDNSNMDTAEELDFRDENPFSFLESQPSLQLLAAARLALRLWRGQYYLEKRYRRPVWYRPLYGDRLLNSCKGIITVSPPIEKIIDDRIVIIGKEIEMWEENFRRAASGIPRIQTASIYDEHLINIMVKGFDNISCNPDGTINFQGSARNVLTKEEELNPDVRFKIACMFCLEEHVRELWPLVSDPSTIFGSGPPLMGYWKDLLNNVRVDSQLSITDHVVNAARIANWAAFDYFWDKTTPENQTRTALKIIQRYDKYDFDTTRRVLVKLGWHSFPLVCERVGDFIFNKFVTEEKNYEYATNLWTRMKNCIPGNVFVDIVRPLWQMTFNPSYSELALINQNSSLLLNVWSSASDSLKSNIPRAELFEKLDCDVRGVHKYDLKFMFELLADSSDTLKKSIWLENWCKLVIRAKPSDLQHLMKLCLVGDDEIQQSKEYVAKNMEKLDDYFNTCVNKGLYSELNDCLSFFAESPRQLENLSKDIIVSNLDSIVSCDEEKLAMCHSFIYNTFRSSERAEKFLQEFILSPECLGWVHSKLDECCFEDVLNLSNKFPTFGKGLQDTKRELLDYCHRNFVRGQISRFNEQKFSEFLCWCSPGEEKISEFRGSLNIDDIFELVLNNFMRDVSAEKLRPTLATLSYFDDFLLWYFGSLEAANFYKSAKISNLNEWLSIKNTLKRGPSHFTEAFLKWSLQDDESKMQEVLSIVYDT